MDRTEKCAKVAIALAKRERIRRRRRDEVLTLFLKQEELEEREFLAKFS